MTETEKYQYVRRVEDGKIMWRKIGISGFGQLMDGNAGHQGELLEIGYQIGLKFVPAPTLNPISDTNAWVKAGSVAVDSGRIIVIDTCYLPKDRKLTDLLEKENYPLILQIADSGVSVAAGFGDGEYNIYADVRDYGEYGKRVKAIKVEFIEDDAQLAADRKAIEGR